MVLAVPAPCFTRLPAPLFYRPAPLFFHRQPPSPAPLLGFLSSISPQTPRMPTTRQKPAATGPRFTADDLTNHCDNYFTRPSIGWNWEDFVSYFATFATFKLDVVNYKWTAALRFIEASPTETASRRSKAQSLLDKFVSVTNSSPLLLFNVSSGVGIG